jgi:hypothetical protein
MDRIPLAIQICAVEWLIHEAFRIGFTDGDGAVESLKNERNTLRAEWGVK